MSATVYTPATGNVRHYTPTTISESTLTSASLCESLASNRTSLRVGPIRRQGAYHGRVITFPTANLVGEEHAVRTCLHAASLLANADGYAVSIRPDGISLAVIARKPA